MVRHAVIRTLACLGALVYAVAVHGQVLPEDRFDALYHSYEGNGVKITGPSLLARKKVTQDLSLSANYYVDSISSASIDVLSYASPYDEERTEYSLGADYLLGETILSAGFTSSDETDFEARTAYFGVRQEVFGGLTSVDIGFARGWDEVGRRNDPDFSAEADRRLYRIGVSQVLTKNLVMNLDFEGISDEGYLNNPYRQVRYEAPDDPAGYRFQPEVYPRTRNSGAFSLGGRYYLQNDSALYARARVYSDSWGIDAWNAEVGYVFRLGSAWLFDASYRYYTQDAADFYSDLFPFEDAQNFLGRDKEISTFYDHSLKLDITRDLAVGRWAFLKRGTLNLSYNLIMFRYEDFRDIVTGGPVGEEPLFEFDADVWQFYVSFWF